MRLAPIVAATTLLTACHSAADSPPPSLPADAAHDSGDDATTDPIGPSTDATLMDPPAALVPFPPADGWRPRAGPGIPPVTFDPSGIGDLCAFLDGGAEDVSDHHNLVTIYDGWLLMPWAPEFGRGGLTFFDLQSPCQPSVRGSGFSPTMRETHAIGFAFRAERRWAVVNSLTSIAEGGIEFWDITDVAAPTRVSVLNTPDFFYPDAYARVTLSVFWQDPWLYVGGAGNGVFIIDARAPEAPVLVGQYVPEPVYRVGQVQALGSVLVLTGAEVARTTLLDVSTPAEPTLIADFVVRDAAGDVRDPYSTNLRWPYLYYANKEGGGGLVVYDLSEPAAPVYAGERISDGNGGYVMLHEDRAFVGESRFAAMYDISDLTRITELRRFDLEGDLDTATPLGHLLVLSVDDDAVSDEGTAITAWRSEPDTTAPYVTGSVPPDGAVDVGVHAPLGISMSELVDPVSVFAGSVRLRRSDSAAGTGQVPAYITAQEQLISIVPEQPLEPRTRYTLTLPPNGIIDASDNASDTSWSIEFTTGAAPP